MEVSFEKPPKMELAGSAHAKAEAFQLDAEAVQRYLIPVLAVSAPGATAR